ncbi:MAG: hypothetical protein ACJ0G8_02145 [Dehalococcoidia bacterium]|tara:strand:+ start:338 stop:550 length:213 start_codon:yes stop_codon:yes gene_type:complete
MSRTPSKKPEDGETIEKKPIVCKKGGPCHWVIEPPNGKLSIGKCKKCGIEKEFENSFEYSSWYGTKSPEE